MAATLIEMGVPAADAEDWLAMSYGDLNDAVNSYFTDPTALGAWRERQAEKARKANLAAERAQSRLDRAQGRLRPTLPAQTTEESRPP